MLVAAALCPCPPLLVPAVAAGAAPELGALRAACQDAIGVLAASRPERLVVIGPAERPSRGVFPPGAAGSFRDFGVDLDVTLGAAGQDAPRDEDVPPLPSSLAVAAWLLRGWSAAPVEGLGVGEQLEPDRCLAAGRAVAGSAERVALLVMGDGSACRSLKAPGYLDERAEAFDAKAAAALAGADIRALGALDPDLAQELKAAGRAPWQVLAGAAEDAHLTGELLQDTAPYGVGYYVAAWT